MTVTELWKHVAYHCRVSRRSPNTIAFYEDGVLALRRFLEATECPQDLGELTTIQLSQRPAKTTLGPAYRRGASITGQPAL
jgi:hypothetical protein